MKTILLFLALLFVSYSATAQKKSPPLFLGIPWGSSVENVRKVVDSIDGITFVEQRWGKDDNGEDDTTVIVLQYSDGEYAGFTANSWHILFFNRKFYYANIEYDLSGGDAISRWEELTDLLKMKLGKPSQDMTKRLQTLRSIRDTDQEIWDEDMTSNYYLFSDWKYKSKNTTIAASCTTGNENSGVEVVFMDITTSKEKLKQDSRKRLKGM